MAFMTLNDVLNGILDRKIIQNEAGRYVFDRKERIAAVLPDELVEYVSGRSASYLSWFLNENRQGDSVREYAGELFDRDPVRFLQETVDKCSLFLGRTDGRQLEPDVWAELLGELGKCNPLFMRGSKPALMLEKMAEAAPHRVLAVLLTEAATGGLTSSRYQEILSFWHLMDREIESQDISNPRHAIQAGEILYVDGQRKAALQHFKRAAEMIEKAGEGSQDLSKESAGRLYLRIGKMYQQGDGCEVDPVRAFDCFEKSASRGNAAAEYHMGILELQDGFPGKAGEHFSRGAMKGDPGCLRMMGNAYFAGDEFVGGQRDPGKAIYYYMRGANPENPAAGDPYCQYMIGEILVQEQEKNGAQGKLTEDRESDPEYWYEAAAGGGSSEAAAALNRRRWYTFAGGETGEKEKSREDSGRKEEEKNRREKYCLLNSFSGKNRIFAESLPEGTCTVIVCTAKEEERDNNTHRALSVINGNRVVWSDRSLARTFREIAEPYIERISLPDTEEMCDRFPDLFLLALSDCGQDNICDGLQSLHTAFVLHEKCSALTAGSESVVTDDKESGKGESIGQWKDRLFYLLADRVQLYVASREEISAPVFDSACSRLGDFYLPLHLCDPLKMTAESLLENMPLFLPCLGGAQCGRPGEGRDAGTGSFESTAEAEPEEERKGGLLSGGKRMDTVIFGDHPGIVQLCKDALAAAQIDGIPFSLTVVGENADELEERFLADCPGIAQIPQGVSIYRPTFLKMRPESTAFQKLLSVLPRGSREPEEEKAAALLQSASYLVVYTESEDRNLTLAMYLREWYIRTDPSFRRLPFIAAYCPSGERAEQLRTLTVGSEELGISWFNNYNIVSFGTEKSLFSWKGLVQNRLERRALASHFSYYGNVEEGRSFCQGFSCPEERHRAEHDYYVRNYNRDSSMINALALPYRLFAAGIFFSDWHLYAAGFSQKRLADRFEEWLKGADDSARGHARLESLAMQEHGRWNRAMITRGWTGASVEQVQTYIQRGVNRHQLYLARLHPFICSWDQLGEQTPEPTGLQKSYGFIMRQIRPGKEPPGIRDIDRENVRKTAMLLREE